ncbi:deoxyribonuclease I [Pseudoalteromonas ulvae UL12]|uniref:endonuclease n=1 Tax=Pseudoalteromonas ulvae TaxID=107327 RepID=UPI00186B5A9F|nr:endonuclease [Pseudoalteromonas ulvae]MBE0362129.1 deoxyribonuclease I [Pseudoalteromonas ulvae UL12]
MNNLKILFSLCIFAAQPALAEHPTSFSGAKKMAEKQIYFDHFKTFYCGCDFEFDDVNDRDGDGNKHETMVNPVQCGYKPRKAVTRSGKANARIDRIEWEHVVPAYKLGGHLEQWMDPEKFHDCKSTNGKALSGRSCAYALSANFKKAHDDLHNLQPAIGELNADRSNYKFTIIDGENREYGNCDFEVDFEQDTVEPPEVVMGNIARTYLYMNKQYQIPMNRLEIDMMIQWNELDPVDEWECKRNKRVKEVQGNDNPFVTVQCIK